MKRRTELLIAAGCALAVTVYLFTFRVLDQTGDSLAYAWSVRTGNELFHPHHLLFGPAARVLHRILSLVWPSTDVLVTMQLHNLAWAAIAIVALYRLGRNMGWSPWTAAAVTSLLAAANGFMEYATQAEVYVPSLACLAVLSNFVLSPPSEQGSTHRNAAHTFWWTLAIGYHQTNVLFVVPMLALAATRREPGELSSTVKLIGATACVCLALYVAAYLAQGSDHSVSGFLEYCVRYAVIDFPSWGTARNVSAMGVARLFKSQLMCFVAVPGGRSVGTLAAAASFGLLLAVLVGWSLRGMVSEQGRGVRAFAVSWLLTYYLFFLWWLPGEKEFFIATLLPVLILMGTLIDQVAVARPHGFGRSTLQLAAGGVAAVLMVHGTASSLLPLHRARGSTFDTAADIAASDWRGSVVATGNPQIQALRYYFSIDGATEVGVPLLRTYATGHLPALPLRPPSRGMLLDLAEIRPDRYNDPSAFSQPREWAAFMRWLFECGAPNTDGGFTALAFDLAPGARRTSLLLLTGESRRYASFASFLGRLDSLDRRGPRSSRGIFTRWFNETRSIANIP